MENRILEVFYGTDGKPYKDQERSVLFPVVGNEYQGANDFTHIRFYYQRLCGEDNTLVAVFKNAKGELGCQPLSTSTDSTRGEKYALLPISEFLTKYKGDIYIALQCYRGDANGIVWDDEQDIWVINEEVPTIRSTANIKMSVNYAPMLIGSGEEEPLTLQKLLSKIAEKSDIDDVILVVGDISQEDLSGYDVGQLFYDNDTHTYYEKTATSPYYTKALSGMGVLGAPNILCRSDDDTRTIAQLHTIYGDSAYIVLRYLDKDYLYFSKKTSSTYTCVAFDIEEQRFYKATGLDGSALPSTMLIPANKIEIASKKFLLDNYVPYNGANADVNLGEHKISAKEVDLPQGKLRTDSVDEGATLLDGQFLYDNDYLNYKEGERKIASVKYALKHALSLSNESGVLGSDQYAYVEGKHGVITLESRVYRFLKEDASYIYYASFDNDITTQSDGTDISFGRVISISKTPSNDTYAYTTSRVEMSVYSKAQAKDKFATDLTLSIDNTTFVLTAKLKNANGVDLATRTIDLPLESIVSSATYYDTYTYDGVTYTKVIVITLSTTSVPTIVPVGDLISGLEKEACVEIPVSPTSGTFTSAQMELLALDNASIKIGGYTYLHKVLANQFIAKSAFVSADGYKTISEYKVVVANNGDYTLTSTTINFYDKSQIDTKVTNLQNQIDTNAGDIDDLEGDVQDLDETKAEKDGNYPTMSVGQADQLNSTINVEDKVPYLFRTSGGTADIGNRENDKIVGGTIVWNQLAIFIDSQIPSNADGLTYSSANNNTACKISGTATTFSSRSGWFYLSEVQSFKNSTGHKVLVIPKIISGSYESGGFVYFITQGTKYELSTQKPVIYTIPDYAQRRLVIEAREGTIFNDLVFTFQVFDLTQMFGSTIADYIYSLEQNEAGSGVAWFKSLFPKDYYAYNSGSLLSVKLTSHDTVGFNQWDEEWELGNYNPVNGVKSADTTHICSKNFIEALPNTTYYFKGNFEYSICYYDKDKNFISSTTGTNATKVTPNNCYYITFTCGSAYGTTYNHDICINLSWSGYRNGEYEPYEKNTYPLDSNIELRGISKLDGNNNLYFEGDEYANDGNVKRKYGIVDLGTLNWDYDGNNVFITTGGLTNSKVPANQYQGGNIICVKYLVGGPQQMINGTVDKVIGVYYVNRKLYCRDTAYTDATTFKNSLNGVYLVYELETPTDETADPYQDPQIVNDFGTEQYVVPTQLTDVEMPVGHETLYPANLRDKVQRLPDMPSADGYYIVHYSNRKCAFYDLSTWLSANGYKTEGAMKDTFGMKDALGGTLRHMLARDLNIDFNDTDFVDLGDVNWQYYEGIFFTDSINVSTTQTAYNRILCSKYKTLQYNETEDKSIRVVYGGVRVNVYDASMSSMTTAQFKNAMKGVLLAYEKAS